MRQARPVIGVSCPSRGGEHNWALIWLAVWLAGGRAVRITPKHIPGAIGIHGLIVGGGANVSATLYGEAALPSKGDSGATQMQRALAWLLSPLLWLYRALHHYFIPLQGDELRDALEMGLIAGAVREGIPILGICRGEQLLNIHFGGSLYQSLDTFCPESERLYTRLPRLRITVTRESKLSAIVGAEPLPVNSLHRQAVNMLGSGLRAVAFDEHGVTQAIEYQGSPLMLGVQWHPEFLIYRRDQRALFAHLVTEATRAQREEKRLQVARLFSPRLEAGVKVMPSPIPGQRFQSRDVSGMSIYEGHA